ncbi:hypothetical protein [Streptomyces sp. NPDC056647]|uniref:hypothetical protein n=1 Tax=Streptomyces sp. NPDC056647 TaxID=3345890 RepID=UPI003686629D
MSARVDVDVQRPVLVLVLSNHPGGFSARRARNDRQLGADEVALAIGSLTLLTHRSVQRGELLSIQVSSRLCAHARHSSR